MHLALVVIYVLSNPLHLIAAKSINPDNGHMRLHFVYRDHCTILVFGVSYYVCNRKSIVA